MLAGMSGELATVLVDLRVESDELDGLVAGLPEAGWARPTPAEGWTIAHQISHLAWTDGLALLAASAGAGSKDGAGPKDGAGFEDALRRAGSDPLGFVERGAAEGAAVPPGRLLERWRAGRASLSDALAAVPPGTRLPWFGPPMSAVSMATARLMETWAHGLDVADALGVSRPPSPRLRHVAHIGARTRDFAFQINGEQPPAEPFRVELTGPSGEVWVWGPPDAAQRVTGPALDFCLLVTRRRHRDDLALSAVGADADRWLDIAQAYAGQPGKGRRPGQFG